MATSTSGRKKSSAKKATRKKVATRPAARTKSAKKGATAPSRRAKKPVAGATPRKSNMPKRKPGPAIEIDGEVLEFMEALDEFKAKYGRQFPSWSEVLWVLRSLGYRKS